MALLRFFLLSFHLIFFFFFPQKAAAPSEGAKRRGRPKKEVRVPGQTVLTFV